MFQDKRPNHLNGHGRVVREFTAVSTKDEFVMCFQFSDGSIGKAYERRAISDERMEVIHHANKDRSGCYYTTRKEYLFSEGAIVNSCFEKKTREELDHEHLEYLCQVALDHIPLSRKQSVQCRHNLLSTMKHWLDVQIQNQSMQEYKKLAEIVAAYERELIPAKEETTMKNTPAQPPAPQRETLPMQVDVKIHSLHASGPVLADASVNLNGCFAIRGVKVVDGTNGPFVSMPSYKGRDGYKDICFPCTKEFHQQFHQAVLDAYQQSLTQIPQQRQPGMGQEEAPPAPDMKM